jgi:ubiquitin-like 1-activating enzyme E1 B
MDKVFNADIKNLLSMADMWRSRDKPTPLDFDAIVNRSFVVKESTKNIASSLNSKGQVNGHANGRSASSSNANGGLKDQRALTLQDNLSLFVSRYTLIRNHGCSIRMFDTRRPVPTA